MPSTIFRLLAAAIALLQLVAAFATSSYARGFDSEQALGQALFQDKNLSADRTVACASCHQADHAFSDSRPISVGVAGQHGTRNAPSLLEIGEYTSFFWDGRATTLDEQVHLTVLSAVECGFSTPGQVIARVKQNPRYVNAFRALDKGSPSALKLSDISHAIVAYERTLIAPPNNLDRYLAGNHSSLSLAAQKGLAVFRGKADCTSCHLISGQSASLTDNQFHSSGVGLAAVTPALAHLAAEVAHLSQAERFQKIASDPQIAALGRYVVTLDPKDIGAFRTPSLRNVALTAPYMHDGSIPTLAQAVDIELYYRGLALGHPILFTSAEKQELLAFLQSLSSEPSRKSAAVFNERARQAEPMSEVRRVAAGRHSDAQARRQP
ncbi:MAG: cytochrome c peroxidase [Gammaproteobacteria bacterium]